MPSYSFQTGRAGNATVNGSPLYITKWETTLETTYSDSTSSASFDGTGNVLWTTQEPGSVGLKGSVEGWWDFNGNASALAAAVLAGTAVPAVLKFDATHVYASGNFQFSNFKIGVEVKEDSPTVGFTADIMSYGPAIILPS